MCRRPLARPHYRARRPRPGTGYKFLVTPGTAHTLPAASSAHLVHPARRPPLDRNGRLDFPSPCFLGSHQKERWTEFGRGFAQVTQMTLSAQDPGPWWVSR